MNISIIRGRLTTDAEVRIKADENPNMTARFSLAVPDLSRAEDDGKHPVDFIKVVAYNGIAQNIAKFTKKGSEVIITGRIHAYSYKNKDKNTVYITEVIADRVEFGAGCILKSDIEVTSDDSPEDKASTD